MPKLSRSLFFLAVVILTSVAGPKAPAAEMAVGPVSLDAETIQIDYPRVRGVGNALVTSGTARLAADEIEVDTETREAEASGNVRFSDLLGAISAERFKYNFKTQRGSVVRPEARQGLLIARGEEATAEPGEMRLSGASATTCDRPAPHYQMTAREIVLYPGDRVVAGRVSVWLGKTRLMTLPKLTIKLSRGAGRRSLLPRIGFDGDDGAFIGVGFPLASSEWSYVGFRACATSRQGLQGSVSSEHLLAGTPAGELGAAAVDPMVELRDISIVRRESEDVDAALTQGRSAPSQVRVYSRVNYRQKAYDIGTDSLWVSELPEIGISYTGPGIRLAKPSVFGTAVSSAVVSYARVSESPGLKSVSRFDARALATVRLANLGKSTVLEPALLARHSRYDSGDRYSVIAGSVNLARMLSRQGYASIRLIRYYASGRTPLESDDVDIAKELQGAAWYRFGKNLIGGEMNYNLANGTIYDWRLTYGRTLHCLEPRITWRNRFSTVEFDLKVIGF